MKSRAIPFFLAFFFLGQWLHGQIDTSRNHEIRFSFVGQSPIKPFISEAIDRPVEYSLPSLSYLRRIRNSKYFMVAEVNGSRGRRAQVQEQQTIVDANYGSVGLFLGAEKQYQFKHFGAYFALGLKSEYYRYKVDFALPDQPPVENLQYDKQSYGPSARLTLYTNFTDNTYLFLTTSMDFVVNREVFNRPFNNLTLEQTTFANPPRLVGIGFAAKF